METSAFGDRKKAPTDAELPAALGPAMAAWDSLKATLAGELAPLTESWSFAGKAYGWSLRLAHRGRPVLYLTPLVGRFRAALALPERAMTAALEADLPEPIRAVVAGAPSYPEGRGIRIEVVSEEDVAGVMTLARIRMAS